MNHLLKKIKKGKYRPYKGREYEFVGIAKYSETLEDLVIYRALYKSKEFGNNVLWARPIKSFLETVTVEGKEIPRFQYIGE